MAFFTVVRQPRWSGAVLPPPPGPTGPRRFHARKLPWRAAKSLPLASIAQDIGGVRSLCHCLHSWRAAIHCWCPPTVPSEARGVTAALLPMAGACPPLCKRQGCVSGLIDLRWEEPAARQGQVLMGKRHMSCGSMALASAECHRSLV
jgi:hypothetical protein